MSQDNTAYNTGRKRILWLAAICVLVLSGSIVFARSQFGDESLLSSATIGLMPWIFGLSAIFIVASIHAAACAVVFKSFLSQGLTYWKLTSSLLVMILVHSLEVHVFGVFMFGFSQIFEASGLDGAPDAHFMDYVYFSYATYTALGLGDIFPMGGLKLMAGLEALSGLIMVGWTASLYVSVLGKHWLQGD